MTGYGTCAKEIASRHLSSEVYRVSRTEGPKPGTAKEDTPPLS